MHFLRSNFAVEFVPLNFAVRTSCDNENNLWNYTLSILRFVGHADNFILKHRTRNYETTIKINFRSLSHKNLGFKCDFRTRLASGTAFCVPIGTTRTTECHEIPNSVKRLVLLLLDGH